MRFKYAPGILFLLVLLVSGGAVGAEFSLNAAMMTQRPHKERSNALVTAACAGNAAEVERLLKAGVGPNFVGDGGETPLFKAVECGQIQGVNAMLKGRADPNQVVPGHVSVLYWAALNSSAPIFGALMKRGGNRNAVERLSGLSLLDAAFQRGMHTGDWRNYYLLLDGGADINAKNARGQTIAEDAALFGWWDKVNELLDRGYTRNLSELAILAQDERIEDANQAKWWHIVRQKLHRRGVEADKRRGN